MTYRPGDYFVARSGSWAGAGIRAVTRSRVNHAGIIIDTTGTTVEARPHGSAYGHARGLIVSPPLTDDQRNHIAAEAHKLLGVGYNWTGLAALALTQYGLGGLPGVQHKLADERDLFCSQEVDLILARVGFHVFDDGRKPGDCSPGDLLDVAVQSNWPMHYEGKVNVGL